MEVFKIKQPYTAKKIKKDIEMGRHTVFFVPIETPVVFVYKEKQVDKDICSAMGYEVCEALYNGGIIVGNNGDMAFAHFGDIENGWMMCFANHFVDWLKAKGLNAEYKKNDVLVDGYKVCGLCTTRYGRIDYTTGFISLNVNLDHIKAICKKPMEKVPKGLSEYGITTEEVEKMFLAFCKEQSKEE